MARTAIAATTLNGWEGAATKGAGTAVDQANGMYVTVPAKCRAVVLEVNNSAAGDQVVTIPRTDAKTGGELAVTIATTVNGLLSIPVGDTNNAAADTDNTINVDFDAGFTGTVWATVVARH